MRLSVPTHRPATLPLIAAGTITNTEFGALMLAHLAALVLALEAHGYVELRRVALIVHA